MRRWISGDRYAVAIVDRDGLPVAYAVWRNDEDGIYVRQFFVGRDHRRKGLGRAGFTALLERWGDKPVKLDALVHNERGLAFWRALGFRDYSLILSLDAASNGREMDRRDGDQAGAEDGDSAGGQDRSDPAGERESFDRTSTPADDAAARDGKNANPEEHDGHANPEHDDQQQGERATTEKQPAGQDQERGR
ncbi:GNAT family N-acetyltransferase [Asanoa ishikariensis]|uniref:GNAT family N-acetyltransferase n=1 Tax=Asanoa ishikariensis TaxID=137265 RepID=UPI001EF1EDEC